MTRVIDHPRWDSSWSVPSEHTIDDLGELGILRVNLSSNKARTFALTMSGRQRGADLVQGGAHDFGGGGRTDAPEYGRPPTQRDAPNDFDVFISHAWEDKESVAAPLATELGVRDWRVWLDVAEITVGDSLERTINQGLACSRFGIVVLSPAFFSKQWPQRELQGLAAREVATGSKVILPVWHNVTRDDVLAYSPVLADKMGASTAQGLSSVATQLERALTVARRRERGHGAEPLIQSVAPRRAAPRDLVDLVGHWKRGGGMGLSTVGVRRSDGDHHSEMWRVNEDGTIDHRWVPSDDGAWEWSQWQDFGSPVPALDVAGVSKHEDHCEVFVLAHDGQVWHRWWSLKDWWGEFVPFGYPFSSAQEPKSIAASSRGDGQMDVVVEAFDGALRIKWHWDGRWEDSGRHDGWHALHG